MSKKHSRVLAVASGGGHWVQLCRLMPAWDGCQMTFVTTDPGFRKGLAQSVAERGQPEPRFFVVQEANRWQKLRLLKSLIQAALILIRVRPDVVVTTGAAPGYFMIRLGKMMGARTIWLDSIANAEELSLSGRMAGRYADLWLTQWPHLAQPDGPRYVGSVI